MRKCQKCKRTTETLYVIPMRFLLCEKCKNEYVAKETEKHIDKERKNI